MRGLKGLLLVLILVAVSSPALAQKEGSGFQIGLPLGIYPFSPLPIPHWPYVGLQYQTGSLRLSLESIGASLDWLYKEGDTYKGLGLKATLSPSLLQPQEGGLVLLGHLHWLSGGRLAELADSGSLYLEGQVGAGLALIGGGFLVLPAPLVYLGFRMGWILP